MNTQQYYGSLSGLRGIGAIWVTLFHIFHQSDNPLISAGYLGVDLFFLLSGFIIAHVHGADFAHGYKVSSHWRFLQLRLVRIYPLHVFVLVLFACFVFTTPEFVERYNNPDRFGFGPFMASLLLVHNWGFGDPTLWNVPTWSLSVEWLAYLAFPFLAIAFSKISARYALLAALLILVLLEIALAITGVPRGGTGKVGLLRIAFEFSAGCFLQRYVSWERRKAHVSIQWAAIGLVSLAVFVPSLQGFAPLGFGLLILTVVLGDSVIAKGLSSRPMAFLGNVSFSLYMTHSPLIQIRNWIVERGFIGKELGLVALLASICVVSVLCWKYVEVPARALGRRKLHKPVAGPDVGGSVVAPRTMV